MTKGKPYKKLTLPFIPANCKSNYHMFYILLPSANSRNTVMARLKEFGIQSVFHYIPLHSSPRGRQFGYKSGDMPVTEDISGRLLRIPFYPHLEQNQQDYVIEKLEECLR